ncbi:MAG: adenosylcobinamide-phosphate synthase CbiB [Lachnospiraceae bacterium]|nr:adenosylcobinamide-phosphate synthase CbiB [Lachnospiraceae bacterium]
MTGYHILAFGGGFLLDLLLGDPEWLPHPIRLIGGLTAYLEKRLNRGGEKGGSSASKSREKQRNIRRFHGALLVLLVLLCTGMVSGGLLLAAYRLHPFAGCLAEGIMTYQILAAKCLRTESMKVYDRLQHGTLDEARKAVSMIVGRDTSVLDETGVAKAAIETVAENTSDGVIAPMLYLALGGPVLGFLYKAVNTMDSMVGYKNERYLEFGRVAAKLDDVVNFIPARLSALLMIGASALLGSDFDAKRAWYIFKRDRKKHASPNSAQTESVCAGALGIRLAGDARYFGKVVKKPFIGDAVRKVETEDIRRANRLMYGTAFLCEFLCLAALLAVCFTAYTCH